MTIKETLEKLESSQSPMEKHRLRLNLLQRDINSLSDEEFKLLFN